LPARGTIAETYLSRFRGLPTPDNLMAELRFAPRCAFWKGFKRPALLMPFRQPFSLDVMAVHRIALNADGSPVYGANGRKLKRSLGAVKGAAMMIGRVPTELILCEGLETGLALLRSKYASTADGGLRSIWALSGATFLSGFQPVKGVKRLVIAADNDEAGRRSAMECGHLWEKAGCIVEIIWPSHVGADFADLYSSQL
jgi:hypothetical protein